MQEKLRNSEIWLVMLSPDSEEPLINNQDAVHLYHEMAITTKLVLNLILQLFNQQYRLGENLGTNYTSILEKAKNDRNSFKFVCSINRGKKQ